MAYYTQIVKRAHDPLSGTAMDMTAIYDDSEGDGLRQVAYCPRAEDAERIKALLAYYGDQFPVKREEGK